MGTTLLNNSGTLAVGANTLTAVGLITNTGTITETTGSIVHAAEYVKFVDTNGTQQSSYTTPGSVYVEVQDSNRNLLGATVETLTIPVTINVAAGSDSETLTLTETGAATGIFRKAAASNLVSSNAASVGNGHFEIIASGTGTGAYTDAQDSTDASSTTASLVFVTNNGGGNSGSTGGGGGGGGGGSFAIAPVTPTPVPATSAPVVIVVPPPIVAPVPPLPLPPEVKPAPTSGVIFTGLKAGATFNPGGLLAFGYTYTNRTTANQTITVVREMKDAKGKVIKRVRSRIVLRAKKSFQGKPSERLSTRLPLGVYEMTVMITDAKGKVIDKNSFNFGVVKKSTPLPPAVKPVPTSAVVFTGLKAGATFNPGGLLAFGY
ncbi:MAG: hypothetical protein Q8R07_00735, partial [Candidatus Uhrbacteria bacterium]|nr:hypothetical protein [Candidatus Uhrbacteria bacterium]